MDSSLLLPPSVLSRHLSGKECRSIFSPFSFPLTRRLFSKWVSKTKRGKEGMCLQYGRERETKARQACLTLAVLGKLGDFAGEEKKNFLPLLPHGFFIIKLFLRSFI